MLTSLRCYRRLFFAVVFVALAGASPATAQVLAPNLLYTSVQPCRVFDTRFATNGTNGRLIHNVAQTFNVVGNNADPYFSGQGGHDGGCSIPGFFGGQPQVQAVVLNFVAINSAGPGDLLAWPTDQMQPNSSVINYASSAALDGLNLANGLVVPVRQNSQGGDVTLLAQVSDTDVLADVVGYFSSASPVQSTGTRNLFLGTHTGNPSVATGSDNTALGDFTLVSNTTGSFNAVFGEEAMGNNTTGSANLALGPGSLSFNTTGHNNTAVGNSALSNLLTGANNLAVGQEAGQDYTGAESNNTLIGSSGTTGDNNTIRIGNSTQTSTFIAGINGVTSSGGTAVFVNGFGQLGTVTSSVKFKDDVTDMSGASAELMQLRPVTFHYKPAYDDGSRLLQYGLIAEEVAKIDPGLVQFDAEGRPLAVRYHFINAMLLNEAQKQHTWIAEQAARLLDQAATMKDQRKRIDELQRNVEAQQRRLEEQAAEITGERSELVDARAAMSSLAARLGKIEAREEAPRDAP